MLRLGKVVVGLGIASAVAFANPTMDTGTLGAISKSDSEFLFKDSAVNAIALSSDEMKATEGEWVPLIFGAMAFFGRYQYANAPRLSDSYAYYRNIGFRQGWTAKTYSVRIR